MPEPMDDDEIADDRTEFELVPQPNEADDDEGADNEHPNDGVIAGIRVFGFCQMQFLSGGRKLKN